MVIWSRLEALLHEYQFEHHPALYENPEGLRPPATAYWVKQDQQWVPWWHPCENETRWLNRAQIETDIHSFETFICYERRHDSLWPFRLFEIFWQGGVFLYFLGDRLRINGSTKGFDQIINSFLGAWIASWYLLKWLGQTRTIFICGFSGRKKSPIWFNNSTTRYPE